ncbi:MAG: YjjG family noncanonical pyrimidine nucleotidase [Bacteroidales bacterium]|nr:YjjG family noncanonical pyrimidine nucleotidase [Bacteroidales bacterium]
MHKNKYKHLFFDLDRTLWDFEASALHTFHDIYKRYALHEKGIESVVSLMAVFNDHNERLWTLYRNGQIAKEVLRGIRFEYTLKSFNIEDKQLADAMSDDYVYYSPRNVHLFPHAIEVLEKLNVVYPLHLITNGFEEVQHKKLETSGLGKFFRTVTTSEEAGVKKPDKGIFEYALSKAGGEPDKSVMIGDDLEVDIEGAKNAGLDQIYFNPDGISHDTSVTCEIRSLTDLYILLG